MDVAPLAHFLELTDDELDWYADRRSFNRRAGAAALHHYRYTWLPGRLIEAPKPRLRAVHRRLLTELLGRVPVHAGVHGFVPGRSAHTFAAAHAGRATVVRVDLTSFFACVTAPRVFGLLRTTSRSSRPRRDSGLIRPKPASGARATGNCSPPGGQPPTGGGP